MPRGENDAAKSRGSALSFVISMLHRMMTTLLRWEAVFRRERRPVSLDRFFRFRHLCAGAGSVRVRERRSAPALIFY